MFVDGDDRIAQGSLKAISCEIDVGNIPDVVCLELVKFWDKNKVTVPMNDGIDERINSMRGDALYEYLAALPKYPASACTKAIRRELFNKNDLYFIKGLLSEDLEWCIRLFLVAKIFRYCPDKYYLYRQARAGSISSVPSEKKTIDVLCTFQKWTEYSKYMNDSAKKRMICSYMEYIFRFLLLGYRRVSSQERVKFRKLLKNGDWVLGNRKDSISYCIRVSYKFLGVMITGMLLEKYLTIRKIAQSGEGL